MSKSKWTPEQKISMVLAYLSGEGSYLSIAKANGIAHSTLEGWVARYCEQGEAGFFKGPGNRHYTKEFKTMCVEAVLRGDGSVDDIVAKNNIALSVPFLNFKAAKIPKGIPIIQVKKITLIVNNKVFGMRSFNLSETFSPVVQTPISPFTNPFNHNTY